jgi:DHA1 family tetracycline resistance protein-like MFS transporter
VLPESLPPERRARFAWRRANPLGALVLLRSHRELLGLAGAQFLAQLAHVALPSTFVLYAAYRYGWNARDVGLTLAGVGVCSMIVQAGLIRPIVGRLGERRTLLLGLLFGAVGFAVYGLAPSGLLFCLGIPVMSLWGLATPAAQGLMTRRVGASEQGRLQGAISSLTGIAGLIGPGLFTLTFSFAIGPARDWLPPGAPFVLAALLLFAATLIAGQATRPG